MDRSDTEVRNDKSYALAQLGRFKDAITEIQEAIRTCPTESYYWITYSQIYSLMNDQTGAKDVLEYAWKMSKIPLEKLCTNIKEEIMRPWVAEKEKYALRIFLVEHCEPNHEAVGS